jgi:hypothetical protein
VTEFDPEQVPTVGLLLKEMDRKGTRGSGTTSEAMQPYVDLLDGFVKKVVRDDKKSKAAEEREGRGDNDLDF